MRAVLGVVSCVLLVACGGSDGGGAAAGTTTSDVAPTAAGTATAPDSAAASPAPAGDVTTVPGPAATSAGGAAKEAPVGARPGTYRYRVVGSSSGGTPPTTRPHDGVSTLTVAPATGREQRSEQRSPEGQGSDLVLRHEADGVRLVSLQLRGQLEKEFRPEPPALMLRAGAKPGDRWLVELTSTDGTTTMRDAIEVVGRDRVEVGGRTVETLKIHHDIRLQTTVNGVPITVTIDRTSWESIEHSLSVKDHSITDVPGFVHDESTSTLESLDPS